MSSAALHPSGQGESFISRSRLQVLYVTFYLALFGLIARMTVFYFVATPDALAEDAEAYRWPATALMALFSLMTVIRHLPQAGLQKRTEIYLAFQASIVFGLLLLPPHVDLYAILFFLLSMQAMLSLPRSRGYAWIGLFAVLGTIGVILDHGLVAGLAQSFIFTAGYYFFGSFAAATAEAEVSRREAYTLLQELQERDQSLRHSEERYRRVVEGCPDAILILDTDGRVVDANESACRMFELSRFELLSASFQELIPAVEEIGWSNLLADEDTARLTLEEVSLPLRDGREVFVDAQFGVINLDGTPHVLAIVRDVSGRKAAQEALFRQTADLAVLAERNRMAREMHDTLAQGFTGIVVQLEAAEQALPENLPEAERHLTMARAQARESLQEARRSVWNLLPGALEKQSLIGALQEEVRRFNAAGRSQAQIEVEGEPSVLEAASQAALLRACQESLTNILRHAGAEQVTVRLAFQPGQVQLIVSDDGKGFEPGEKNGDGSSFGLRGMAARLGALGGTLEVKSAKGAGTEVRVALPSQAVERVATAGA